jgi:hypothetical protein
MSRLQQSQLISGAVASTTQRAKVGGDHKLVRTDHRARSLKPFLTGTARGDGDAAVAEWLSHSESVSGAIGGHDRPAAVAALGVPLHTCKEQRVANVCSFNVLHSSFTLLRLLCVNRLVSAAVFRGRMDAGSVRRKGNLGKKNAKKLPLGNGAPSSTWDAAPTATSFSDPNPHLLDLPFLKVRTALMIHATTMFHRPRVTFVHATVPG